MKTRIFTALLAAVLALGHAQNQAQGQVLLREIISRELSVGVDAVDSIPQKNAVSRELTISVEKGRDGQRIESREYDLVSVDSAAPPALDEVVVTGSPLGDSATLDWLNYNQFAIGDIARFDIYLSDDGPFTTVAGLTPVRSVGAGTTEITLDGLTPFRDHFFAVVAVDAFGNFLATVNYSAAYSISPETISREMTIFTGGDAPPLRRIESREIDLVITTAAPPPAIAQIVVTVNPSGGTASLDWTSYNAPAIGDIVRYDIYLSDDGAFSNVTGLTPFLSVAGNRTSVQLTGLTPGRDHFFAVVPVDALGNFTSAIIYAASYVISPESISREYTFHIGHQAVEDIARRVESREMSIVVSDAAVPDPVTGQGSGFTAITSTTAFGAVDLDWTSYNEIGQKDISRYRIYIGTSFFDNVTGLTPSEFVQTGIQSHSVRGLTGLGIFHFAVVAEDILGGFNPVVRSFSAQASVSGVGEVENLAGTSTSTSILFTWIPPAGAGAFLQGYRVYFGGASVPVSLPASATMFQANDLAPATGYAFRITTLDLFGNESGGATLFASTLLPNPANVELTASNGQVILLWDGVQPSSLVSAYEVYRADAPFTNIANATQIASGIATSAMLGTFAAVDGKYFAVVTVNVLGSKNPVVASLLATKQFQTIDFPAPTIPPSGSFSLAASATSGLPVTYGASPPGLAQITGNSLQPLGGGRVTVTAFQNGNATFWPADPVERMLRLPPLITGFAASGVPIINGLTLTRIDEVLSVTASDLDGIQNAEFFIRPGGGQFISLGIDMIPGDGFTATLPLDTFGNGAADLRVVVQTPEGIQSELVRSVVLQLGAPPAPTLTTPINGSTVDTATLAVTGTASRGAQVFLFRDATQIAGPFVADASGAFSGNVLLIPGVNTLTARATNAVGTSDPSTARAVTLRSVLTVMITPTTINEGSSGTVRVLRNHTQGSVQIGLGAAPAGQVTVANTLQISDGATEASTALATVNDNIAELDSPITVTATAAGYVSGNGSVTIRDDDGGARSDLVVSSITAPAQAGPGDEIEIVWTITNQGSGPAQAGWSDQIFISDDNAIGGDRLIATSNAPNPLAAGQSIERRLRLTLPVIQAGNQLVVIRTNAGQTVFESNFTNNSTIDDVALVIPATLTLDLGRATVRENLGAFEATLRRNGDSAVALVVTLGGTPSGEVQLPATVEIPAGQSTVAVNVQPVDNLAFTGTRSVSITASAAGYQPGSAVLEITDDDVPGLSLTFAPPTVAENATNPASTATIRRNSDPTLPLVVDLISANPGSADVPISVTIPAGAATATFPVTVINDAVLTGTRAVRITASAPGQTTGSGIITVTDDDLPGITLDLLPTAVSEGSANPASTGRVVRDRIAVTDVRIALFSSDPTRAAVPSTVIIPVDRTSVTFPITVFENDTSDGTSEIVITATETDSVLFQPIPEQSAQATLQVFDNEGPRLALAAAATVVSGQAINATVSRAPGVSGAVLVTLVSDAVDIQVPASVTINDGQASATFAVSAASGLTRATPATIVASAPGFHPAAIAVTATSGLLPDLSVVEITPEAVTGNGGSVLSVSYAVENDGSAAAVGSWVDRIFLTNNPVASGGVANALMTVPGPLAVGAPYMRTVELTLPTTPGQYWLALETDAQRTLAEGSESNNIFLSAVPIMVSAPYRVTISTDIDLAASGTPIPLRGQALQPGADVPIPNALVSIRVLVNGTRRVILTQTDAAGAYLTTFRPLPTETGHYTVAAAHPDVPQDVPQDDFELIGLRAEPAALELRLAVGQPVSGQIEIRNSSEIALSGITAVAQTAATNIATNLQGPASLAPGETGLLQYTLTANTAAFSRARVLFRLGSTQGAVLDVPVTLSVLPAAAQLVINPGVLETGMVRGTQKIVECDLTNLGSAQTGALEVQLPVLPWLTLASPATIPSLPPGASTRLVFQLLPGTDLPLNLYTGNIAVRGQTGILIPFRFRAISNAIGDVRVNVQDDYTYYTPDAPQVDGATVRIRDSIDQSVIIAQGRTDASGSVFIPTIREGTYALEVSAPGHSTSRSLLRVLAGLENVRDVFIDRQTVTYRWTVVPTEIEDRYEIKLIATFEVDVPVPVVTMDVNPGVIPDLAPGETFQLDVKLTNHGLIAAEQVVLNVPGLTSGFEFLPLIRDLDVIAAKSSVNIPVIVRRAASVNALTRSPARTVRAGGGADCIPFITAIYSYECGPDRRYHQTGQPMIVSGEICPGVPGFPVGFYFFGGTADGGGAVLFPIGAETADDCDPCAPIKAKALFDCLLGFVPGLDVPKCLYGILNCAMDASDGKITSPISCFRSGQSCAEVGADATPLGPVLSAFDCAVGFIQAYLDCQQKLNGTGGGGTGGGGGTSSAAVPRTIARFQARTFAAAAAGLGISAPPSDARKFSELADMLRWLDRLRDQLKALEYLFGDEAWLRITDITALHVWFDAYEAATDDASPSGVVITAEERATLLATPLPGGITPEIAGRFIDRLNRTADYYSRGILNSTQLRRDDNTDFYALDLAIECFGRATRSIDESLAEGFESPIAGLAAAMNDLRNQGPKKTQGVCARVKLQIDQQAVLTRQAFLGTLEVTNGNETETITDVRLVLDIRDEAGNSANDQFFVRGPDATGLADVGGKGALAPGATGILQYTFIPKRDAAPLEPTVYLFAGTLHYQDGDQTVALPMLASPVTVYPDARLVLRYFQQRDVFSDDPFTTDVEPEEPFSLGLIVTNEGRGTARNFSITSAQPRIIENDKGLLIDFKIIGTQVGNQTLDPSLTVNLGNVEPGASQVAQFILTASLQGKFVDYEASFEHANELGGMETSLIDRVEIHELIRTVRADREGDDALPDFLTNEVPDDDDFPDTLFFSDSTTAPVNAGTNAEMTLGTLQGALAVNMPTGWSFVRLPDLGGHLKLVRAVRSDGKVLRVGDNVWQTDRSFPNSQSGATRERLLHLLDFDSTGSYTLFYSEADAPGFLPPRMQVSQVGPVNPAARITPLDEMLVQFTRPIDPESFTAADVFIRFNDGADSVLPSAEIEAVDETTYRITGFAGLNAVQGSYALTVQAGGIVDITGRAGQGAATAFWALSGNRLATLAVGGFGGRTERGFISALDITFSVPVDPGSVTLSDFTLSRNGGPDLLIPAVTLTFPTPGVIRLNGLVPLTSISGVYTITARASTMKDLDGVDGVGALSDTFVIDSVGPVASLESVTSPRSTPIGSVEVVFSEPIAPDTFTLPDIGLTRNGRKISTGVAGIRMLDPLRFQIFGLAEATGLPGTYRLEVIGSGISDTVGNPGSGSTSRTWMLSMTRPGTPSRLSVSPDTGVSAKDGITSASSITIRGNVGKSATQVRAVDRTTATSLGFSAADGTFALTSDFAVPGLHIIDIFAVDEAGNVSNPAQTTVFIDRAAPVATVAAITPNPRETPVSDLTVRFGEEIRNNTFKIDDISLTRNSTAVPLRGISIRPGAAGIFVVSGLAELTNTPGAYQLSINAGQVEDIAGNIGQGITRVEWRRLDTDREQKFAPFAGAYTGLIGMEEPQHQTSGILRVDLTKTGSFTANLIFGGAKSTARGKLDADGQFNGLAGSGEKALGITLTLITTPGANAIVGSVTDGIDESGFIADRAIFSKSNPTPLEGTYVVILGADTRELPGVPTGDGFATVKISSTGAISTSGQLANGVKFSQGSLLAGSDEWPLYVDTDNGKSSVFGRIYFRDLTDLSDLDGTIHWFQTFRKGKAYPNAFSAQLPMVGARYEIPESGQPVFDFGTTNQTATLIITDDVTEDAVPIELAFTFASNGTANFANPGALQPRMQLAVKTGLITGSILLPGTTRTTPFQGIVFPKQKGASGYFIRLFGGGLIEIAGAE